MTKALKAYETDASQIKGRAKGVFFPESIPEVQEFVKREERICIRGGGTGYAGGAVPEQGQDIVLVTSKLKKIGAIDLTRKTIEVEAGVILQDLQNHVKKYNLMLPIEPLSRSVCTVGGMVATNATDFRSKKYKDTQEWVRWIEVVDGEGNIDRKGKTEISDYAGLEGITGVIVTICFNLVEPKKRTATLVKLSDPKNIQTVLKHLRRDPHVSMIEYVDRMISRALNWEDRYHIIIEYENDTGVLRGAEYNELMHKLQELYTFLISEGYTRLEDPKIIPDRFSEFQEWFEVRNIPMHASLGSGILHPAFYKDQEKFIPEMYKLVKKHSGKISASYGIGIIRKENVEINDKKILENIKKRTDPQQKFNVGKVL